ncbi:MAG: hypothetical protein AUG49_16500 [Catenulispora sp. 13_1_20CM_3_70_7]|nr:hypothetical protein [Catenulisporales bacterium]OLE23268.1 MAG: hypothetical protein AUG49_16500 [Catenulispora sp. 13_1_20CM_3_70_7]
MVVAVGTAAVVATVVVVVAAGAAAVVATVVVVVAAGTAAVVATGVVVVVAVATAPVDGHDRWRRLPRRRAVAALLKQPEHVV